MRGIILFIRKIHTNLPQEKDAEQSHQIGNDPRPIGIDQAQAAHREIDGNQGYIPRDHHCANPKEKEQIEQRVVVLCQCIRGSSRKRRCATTVIIATNVRLKT